MEKWLHEHLLAVHADKEVRDIARECCSSEADRREMTLLAYYMAAVREKEREHMPLIGPSVDRRSLAYVHQVCRSETVEALMCFTCGQIHTHVACWDRLWREPPQANALNSTSFKGKSAQSSGSPHPSPATDRYNNSRSPISFHKVRDSLVKLLITKPWESAEDTAHAR